MAKPSGEETTSQAVNTIVAMVNSSLDKHCDCELFMMTLCSIKQNKYAEYLPTTLSIHWFKVVQKVNNSKKSPVFYAAVSTE